MGVIRNNVMDTTSMEAHSSELPGSGRHGRQFVWKRSQEGVGGSIEPVMWK